MEEAWNLISSKLLVESPWLQVYENAYELPNGVAIPHYYITERNDAALCVCYTGEQFLLVHQYRAGIKQATLCHPGGRLESTDSSPISGALRELLEETGCVADAVESLGTFAQIPAVSSANVHLFLVRCAQSPPQVLHLDKTEDLNMRFVSPAQLKQIIDSGQMNCIACVAASYRALARLVE